MTAREQIIKTVATTDDSQLLQDMLAFLQEREQQADHPPRGSYAALMQYAGSISDEDAQEMHGIINREFNNIEGEW